VAKRTIHSDPPTKAFIRHYHSLVSHGHSGWKVFADFCAMAAMSLANAVARCDSREAKYMEVVGRYSRAEVDALCAMLACVVEGLDHEADAQLREDGKPAFPRCDFLGAAFMELELSNHWRGQYFTPYPLCEMMARLTFDPEGLRATIDQEGFVTVMEPACGAGAMIIAFASAMLEAGINPQQHLHATAIDVDETAAYMAFIQLSVLGLPATVYVGNTLTGQMREELHTPFHHLGLWDWKIHRRRERQAQERAPGDSDLPPPRPSATDDPSSPLDAAAPPEPYASPVPRTVHPPSPSPTGTSSRGSRDLRPPPATDADVTLPAQAQIDLFA
jgi:N-6 DNA Methylase